MFEELPIWGLYVRHIKGLTMENIKITTQNTDYRPAIAFDDIENLKIDSLYINESKTPNIIIKDVSNPEYANILLPNNKKGIYIWK